MPITLRTVLSDGSENPDREFDLPIRDRDGDETDVVVVCRTITRAERREIHKASEKLEKNPRTRGMERRLDLLAAQDETLRRGIVSWRGLNGADDQPLVCTDETKVLLDDYIVTQIVEAVLSGEGDAAQAASFRQLEGVG